MNNYRNIKIAFSYFPAFTEESPNIQKRDFQNAKGTKWIDFLELRKEIERAESDHCFNWLDVASEKDFVKLEQGMTEQEVLLEFKLLTWESIFPDQIFTEAEVEQLQKWLVENLHTDNFISLEHLRDKLNTEENSKKEVGDFELLRAYLFQEGYRKIMLKHEIGTDKRYFKLLPVNKSA